MIRDGQVLFRDPWQAFSLDAVVRADFQRLVRVASGDTSALSVAASGRNALGGELDSLMLLAGLQESGVLRSNLDHSQARAMLATQRTFGSTALLPTLAAFLRICHIIELKLGLLPPT